MHYSMIVDPIFLLKNGQIPKANKCWMMKWQSCDFKSMILESFSVTFFYKLLVKLLWNFTDLINWQFTLVTSCQSVNVGFYQLVTLLYRCNSDLIFKAWKSCLALSISFNFPSISNIVPSKLLQTFFFYMPHIKISDNVNQYSNS